ncbi:hypothetical protein D1007_00814 [Hordeum vulgare]|nr:hypothetical protein D1007_00814 [Hordeum vulgare]
MKLLAVLIDATTMTIGMGGADGVIVGLGRAGAQECDTHSPATLATGAAKMPRNVIVTALEANDASMKTLLLLPLLPRCCGGQALAATSCSAMWSFCPSKGRCRLYQGDAVRHPAREAAPAAKLAEKMVGRTLGIIRDGKDVTEVAIEDFTTKFNDQLAPELIMALREFFHLDDSVANGIEEALLAHGGKGAPEIDQMGDAAVHDA